jgi:hypothetical protein
MMRGIASILCLIIICSICYAETVELQPGEKYWINCVADREQELWEIDVLGVRKQTFDDYLITAGMLLLSVWGMSEGNKLDSPYAFITGVGFGCAFTYRIGF